MSSIDAGGVAVIVEIVLLVLIAVVPLGWRFRASGIRALVEPVGLMSATVLLYYAGRGAVLLFRDSIPGRDALLAANPATSADLAWTLGYVLAGFCAFHAGYRFWKAPAPRAGNRGGWTTEKVHRAVLVGIGLAMVSTAVAIYAAGGIKGAIQTFGCWRVVTTGYGYPMLALGYWGITFAFLLQDRLRVRRNIAIAIPLLVVANLIDTAVGNRTGVLATWATAMILILYSAQRRRPIRTAVLFVTVIAAGVVFAVPMARARSNCVAGTIIRAESAATAKRASSDTPPPLPIQPAQSIQPAQPTKPTPPTQPTQPGQPAESSLSATAERTFKQLDIESASRALAVRSVWLRVLDDFVALDSFATIVAIGPSHFPFKYGKTYLDSVLFLVPRKVWPDKPRAYGNEVGQYLQKVDNNLPPGFIGELYINFHLPGILAGMYLMGVLLRWTHGWLLGGDTLETAVYSVVAPYLVIFMGRSIIGGGTLVFILLGLTLPIAYYLRRIPAQARVRAAGALAEG